MCVGKVCLLKVLPQEMALDWAVGGAGEVGRRSSLGETVRAKRIQKNSDMGTTVVKDCGEGQGGEGR